MKVDSLQELPEFDELGVIVNCSTLAAATLALLSAARYFDMPLLLIDCESHDGSFEHFEQLLQKHEFFLLAAPLRAHGKTLDWLFGNVRAKKILLIDSDVEVLGEKILQFMRAYIDAPLVFGSGFVQGPTSIDDKPGTFLEDALLAERPWIPLVMLRVDRVREALASGSSFAAKTVYSARFGLSSLARRLIELRSVGRLPRFIRLPNWLRESHFGHRREVVYFDTGGQLFHRLRYEKELFMVALPERMHQSFCTHFGGLTRAALGETGGGGDSEMNPRRLILSRLRLVYGFEASPDETTATGRG